MVSWWVIAAAVLFPLAQVPLVLWVGRYFALEDEEEPATPEVREYWTGEEGDGTGPGTPASARLAEANDLPETPSGLGRVDADDDPGAVRCPDCGTVNDAVYRFCGECATEL